MLGVHVLKFRAKVMQCASDVGKQASINTNDSLEPGALKYVNPNASIVLYLATISVASSGFEILPL